MGRVELDGLLFPGSLALRSFWKIEYGLTHIELHCGSGLTYCAKVEAQAARVVLDRDDHHCGAPLLVDLVYSLDHKMGPSLGYRRYRFGRFLPDTLGPFGRRKGDARFDHYCSVSVPTLHWAD